MELDKGEPAIKVEPPDEKEEEEELFQPSSSKKQKLLVDETETEPNFESHFVKEEFFIEDEPFEEENIESVTESSEHSLQQIQDVEVFIEEGEDLEDGDEALADDAPSNLRKRGNLANMNLSLVERAKANLQTLKTFTEGKVDINNLQIEMMKEKHALEMRILAKSLELKELECQIKKQELDRILE